MKKFYVKFVFSFIFLFFCFVSCDELVQRKKLKECFSKEIDQENKAAIGILKLNDDQLNKLKKIVYDEIDKEPLKKHTPEEQAKCYKNMEDVAKKLIPEIKEEAIDKILHIVKDKSMHCVKEMRS